jgi:hypothetical protein
MDESARREADREGRRPWQEGMRDGFRERQPVLADDPARR